MWQASFNLPGGVQDWGQVQVTLGWEFPCTGTSMLSSQGLLGPARAQSWCWHSVSTKPSPSSASLWGLLMDAAHVSHSPLPQLAEPLPWLQSHYQSINLRAVGIPQSWEGSRRETNSCVFTNPCLFVWRVKFRYWSHVRTVVSSLHSR